MLGVYGKFYNKWLLSMDEKKKWNPGADEKFMKKFWFAIRMVEDGALEAYDDVSLHDRYDRNHVVQNVGGNEIIDVNGDITSSSFLNDEMERVCSVIGGD